MNRKLIIIILVAVLMITAACNLPFLAAGSKPASTPNTSIQPGAVAQGPSSQPAVVATSAAVAPVAPTSMPQATTAPTTVADSFPLPQNSQLDPNNSSSPEPGDKTGSFTIDSSSGVAQAVNFYLGALPKQGWTLRYSDANFSGGLTQYWKKDDIFLSLDFTFDQMKFIVRAQYNRVDPQAVQGLPEGFPLPGQAELTQASDTDWNFYVPQDYNAVAAFFAQKTASLNWKLKPGSGPMGGSCGGSDCGFQSMTFPAGVTPLPTATLDLRPEKDLEYILPDGNDVKLTITPHQNATILYIDLTLKNIASAGLPTGVPIYQGAVPQMIIPGTAGFEVPASYDTIKNFYLDQMQAAGWAISGTPIETTGAYIADWTKGNQALSITITANGDNDTYFTIACSSCKP